MRSDLSNLAISKELISNATGVRIDIFQPKNPITDLIESIKEDPSRVGQLIILFLYAYGYYLLLAKEITCNTNSPITFFIHSYFLRLSCSNPYRTIATVISTVLFGLFMLWLLWMILDEYYFTKICFKFTREKHLKSILKEIKQYNQLIKAIDINDQLETVNNQQSHLTDRQKVIEALKLTRLDLIRALQTERILWENKGFIQQNPTMFVNSLEALESLKMKDKASEYGQFLDAALQVAVNTEKVMERLQNRH